MKPAPELNREIIERSRCEASAFQQEVERLARGELKPVSIVGEMTQIYVGTACERLAKCATKEERALVLWNLLCLVGAIHIPQMVFASGKPIVFAEQAEADRLRMEGLRAIGCCPEQLTNEEQVA